MTAGERQRAFESVWNDPGGVVGFVRTVQNIPLAHRYMVTAFAFFLIGGVQALVLRLQLATADGRVLDAAVYNRLFTMHGTTMMFLFVIPFLEAIANYLLPLILGTRDLPFPRLTALSYWTYLFGGLFLYASFFVGAVPDGGWFAYVPLTGPRYSPGLAMDFWDIGLSVAEVAALGAAAELIVGILRMRAPGMRLDRLPLFAWTMLVTAVMIIFAFTPLIVGTAMLELDRKGLTRFFDADAGARHAARPAAAVRVDDARHGGDDHLRVHAAHRRHRHARAGPQGAHAVLRSGGGRQALALAASLLGVRPS